MKEYWFKHHGKASADPRMKLLKETFGYAGIGVYWEIVEYIETWGDGQFPLKELVAAIRSPRVSEKMLRSILNNFFLFDRNEFNDVVRSDIPVGNACHGRWRNCSGGNDGQRRNWRSSVGGSIIITSRGKRGKDSAKICEFCVT